MKRPTLLKLFGMLLFFGLFIQNPANAEQPINVYVSIPPQVHFVKAIGGPHVNISVMVDPGQNPASYEPSPRQMVKLARADIYFAIGVPFETAWLDKFADANPDMRIIHTAAGIEKRPIHRHGGHHKTGHSHEGIKDPHVWLSPPLVMLQARHIIAGLASLDPENTADYEKNYADFINRLVELDTRLLKTFTGIKRPQFMVFHPSWGYFADAYGLEQIAIEIEGKDPKAKDVTALIQTAKKNDISIIFAQPQFSVKQAKIIAREISGTIVQADPLAENWEQNLKQVASAIKEEL
ncbi:MAG: metal ABC transporter solute-binding protein, Zn/Mn family [Desulfobacterales bacterium]